MTLFAGASRSLWCRLGRHRTHHHCTCTVICVREGCLYFKVMPERGVECDAHFNRVWDGISHKLGA